MMRSLKDLAKSRFPRAYESAYPYYFLVRRLAYRARLRRQDVVELELGPPFERHGEFAWRVRLLEMHWLADRTWPPYDSPLELFEDGRPLGPAHATIAELESGGGGRYGHLGGSVYFTTSDGSDPNCNGKRYRCRVPIDHDVPFVDVRFLVRTWTWSAAFGVALAAALALPRKRRAPPPGMG